MNAHDKARDLVELVQAARKAIVAWPEDWREHEENDAAEAVRKRCIKELRKL